MAATAFNPSDPSQLALLNALALEESGGASNAQNLGAHGTDLTAAPRDQYGFPQWSGTTGGNGVGTSHGAGIFQFEPGTWQSVADKYNLNFASPTDQYAGAWYLAQDTYAKKTGGDLASALKNGDYSSVQSALDGTWDTSGNGATPHGLAYDIAHGVGSPYYGGNGVDVSNGTTATGDGANAPASTGIASYFARGGLLLVGGLVVLVALWALLTRQGVVPSPAKIAAAV